MIDAGRVLTMALTVHDADGWCMASRLWSLRQPPEKRMAHALAALVACEGGDIRHVCTAALGGAGTPIAPFLSYMDEASFWADMATPDELKAYSVACYLRLSARDRMAFHDWTDRRAAA